MDTLLWIGAALLLFAAAGRSGRRASRHISAAGVALGLVFISVFDPAKQAAIEAVQKQQDDGTEPSADAPPGEPEVAGEMRAGISLPSAEAIR